MYRNISLNGIKKTQGDEGLRLKAYKDIAGVWTIGRGHIRTAKEGMVINLAEADKLFAEDMANIAIIPLNNWCRKNSINLNQNQFDALCSLIYNIGFGSQKYKNGFICSSVAKYILKGDFKRAGESFLLWNKAKNPDTGILEFSQGLHNRRIKEKELFNL